MTTLLASLNKFNGNFLNTLAIMTSSATSTEGGRHWSSYVFGKIRSLWSAGTSSVGLNQLVSGTT